MTRNPVRSSFIQATTFRPHVAALLLQLEAPVQALAVPLALVGAVVGGVHALHVVLVVAVEPGNSIVDQLLREVEQYQEKGFLRLKSLSNSSTKWKVFIYLIYK